MILLMLDSLISASTSSELGSTIARRPASRGPAEDGRSDRLADLGVFGDDQPLERAANTCVLNLRFDEADASFGRVNLLRRGFNLCVNGSYLSFGGANLLFVNASLRRCVIRIGFGCDPAFEQIRLSGKLEATLLHVCLGLRQACAGLLQLGFRLDVRRLIVGKRTLHVAQLTSRSRCSSRAIIVRASPGSRCPLPGIQGGQRFSG